jgi:hypothetical protein
LAAIFVLMVPNLVGGVLGLGCMAFFSICYRVEVLLLLLLGGGGGGYGEAICVASSTGRQQGGATVAPVL